MVLEVWRVEVVHLFVLRTAAVSSELNTTAWVCVPGQGVSEHIILVPALSPSRSVTWDSHLSSLNLSFITCKLELRPLVPLHHVGVGE